MSTANKIEFKNVYKIFGPENKAALQFVKGGGSKQELLEEMNINVGINNISLSIKEQELFVIMGLSGSGKSTLVRFLNGLIRPSDGQVIVDGQDTSRISEANLRELRRNKVSMVFQKFGLLPHKTVLENVYFGLQVRGDEIEEAIGKAEKWVKKVGLSGYEHNYPRQLSGGMQQRVGIARALAVETDILIMDEPFSALDPLIRADMQDILLGLKKDIQKTIVFVTHDLDEAIKLADHMAILKDGELVQLGTPKEIIENPKTGYVSNFVQGAKV